MSGPTFIASLWYLKKHCATMEHLLTQKLFIIGWKVLSIIPLFCVAQRSPKNSDLNLICIYELDRKIVFFLDRTSLGPSQSYDPSSNQDGWGRRALRSTWDTRYKIPSFKWDKLKKCRFWCISPKNSWSHVERNSQNIHAYIIHSASIMKMPIFILSQKLIWSICKIC